MSILNNLFATVLSMVTLSILNTAVAQVNLELNNSHCKPDEIVQFTAAMGKEFNGKFQPNTKILSLCSDRKQEPYGKLDYRYGQIGKIELQFSAPKDGLYEYSTIRNDPKSFDTEISFKIGKVKYSLIDCLGMTCERTHATLTVFIDAKKVAIIKADPNETYDAIFQNIDFEGKGPKSKFFLKNDRFVPQTAIEEISKHEAVTVQQPLKSKVEEYSIIFICNDPTGTGNGIHHNLASTVLNSFVSSSLGYATLLNNRQISKYCENVGLPLLGDAAKNMKNKIGIQSPLSKKGAKYYLVRDNESVTFGIMVK